MTDAGRFPRAAPDRATASDAAPRLLWLSNETPDIRGQGGQRRQYFQIRELVRAGYPVDVMTLAGDQDDASIRQVADVRRVHRHRGRGLPDPWGRWSIVRALSDPSYRGVIVAHLESWTLVERAVARRRDVPPVLVDLHNVLSSWARRTGRIDDSLRYADREREVLAAAHTVAVCSPEESTRLVEGGAARRIVVPHGIDPDEWPDTERLDGPPAVGAIGNWDWAPNRNGIGWFLTEVWPSVTERVPAARFVVAGTGLPDELASLPGVASLGRVEDRRDVISRVDAMVVPILEGVGAPVKFAEALATGRPVIATPEAASGHPDTPALVAVDPAAWAELIVDLLEDGGAARDLGARTRGFALERLTWARTTRPMIDWTAEQVEPVG